MKVIARHEVNIDGKSYAVAVLAPKHSEDKPEPIASRNDAGSPGQRFMREQRASYYRYQYRIN